MASIGTVGDAYDNALGESFVDSYKTELIADRVWRTRAQLELATVEWIGWFNHDRLHEALGDIPPVEIEHNHAAQLAAIGPIPCNGSVASTSPGTSERLTTRRLAAGRVELGLQRSTPSENGVVAHTPLAQAAPHAGER